MKPRPIRHDLLLALALAVGALSTLVEGARNLAEHQATLAAEALERAQPAEALAAATAALACYPYDSGAQYTQLAAQKRLGRWTELLEAARRARPWDPDQTLLLQLAGEAAWRAGAGAEAAEALWAALWRTPAAPQTPAQIWRVALLTAASPAVWGPRDPRVAAAAVRTLALLGRDVTMANPAIRGQTLKELAAALAAAGAPLTAALVGEK